MPRKKHVQPWLDAVVSVETDECIEFPFKRNKLGYGMFVCTTGRENRKYRRAHNYVCEKAHGPAPEGCDRAIHSCDNPPCVNKRHLRWGSAADNSSDMVSRRRHHHGSKHSNAKLSDSDVQEIRRVVGSGVAQKDVAARFNVSRATVCEIVNRKLWRHV